MIVDDRSGQHPGRPLGVSGSSSVVIDVIAAPPDAPGGLGGLFVKVSAGIRHVLATTEFDLLLRLDTDALNHRLWARGARPQPVRGTAGYRDSRLVPIRS